MADTPPNPKKRPASSETGLEPEKKKVSKGPKEWTITDDITLKDGVQGNSDFYKMSRSLRFSVHYSAPELQARWRLLLYDPVVSEQVTKAMSQQKVILKRALWSDAEIDLLRQATQPDFKGFQNLLESHRAVFHPVRTARSLESHYERIKKTLIADAYAAQIAVQKTKPILIAKATATPGIVGNDNNIGLPLPNPIIVDTNKIIEETNQFDWKNNQNVIALFYGQKIKYLITNNDQEINLGRKSTQGESNLQIDLSEEGEAGKISRLQATIQVNAGKIMLIKKGKATTEVEQNQVEGDGVEITKDISVIRIGTFHFILAKRPQM